MRFNRYSLIFGLFSWMLLCHKYFVLLHVHSSTQVKRLVFSVFET